jgi:Tol biopolymer transport system component
MNGFAFGVFGLALILGSAGRAQVTQLVNQSSSGAQGNQNSGSPSLSGDGRYVAFYSWASNLVAGDTNALPDVFVRDRQSGTAERVSVASNGAQANGHSAYPAISADGRYVAFVSDANNLVPSDTNGHTDVFVHDRQSGATERVSVAAGGAQGNGDSGGLYGISISADGRYVAFLSHASNLVPGVPNGTWGVFVHDRQSGATEMASTSSSGTPANDVSYYPSISADGRCVAFTSDATNLVPGDTNGRLDVFVHDRQTNIIERVSVDSQGVQSDGDSYVTSLSADGRFVAFGSNATNLVHGDTHHFGDIFVRDRSSSSTERVSVNSDGRQAEGGSAYPAISADGRYVAFMSWATNLVPGDTNGFHDVFVRDRQRGTTELSSVDSGGTQGNQDSGDYLLTISADGRFVAFESYATNLVRPGTNAFVSVFIRDRDGSGFTSLCDPGIGGVIPCPCSNPPDALGRGCDNSSATGGAILSASGIAYLSMDSLAMTTSDEVPTATSIVIQGDTLAASGRVFGQGVRCVSGALERLYTKAASAGSITAPDFGAGDPTVSARSATLGDVIQAGQSRWYLVYYRDPIVLSGCPASSTFNATQTGQVVWSL